MHEIIINFVLLLLLWFGIYLHLVIANKTLTNFKKQCSDLTPIVDQPYTSHELPPFVSSCHIIPHNLLSDEHV
jgi:hypothetical protein